MFAMLRSQVACDRNVTIVTEFPFMGGSLSGIRDVLAQHADPLLQPHFLRYQETLIVSNILSHVVVTSEISKRGDKYILRKLWVVL